MTDREWRGALFDELQALSRWHAGRFVAEPAPADELVPAERYLDRDFLIAAIQRAKFNTLIFQPGSSPDDEVDIRAAISRFTRQYSGCLTYVAMAALARGVGLDLSIPSCRMAIRYEMPFAVALELHGGPFRCAERPTDWAVDGRTVATLAELREHVWRKLYAEHIVPVFEVAARVAKTSPHLSWSSAAESAAMLSDSAEEYLTPEDARPYVDDREALLEADALPGVEGPNPLRGLVTWLPHDAPAVPSGVLTRRICCLAFYMPDRLGRLCQTCGFLPIDERVALVRERHGLPQSAPRGPAEETAKRRGMEKLGMIAR